MDCLPTSMTSGDHRLYYIYTILNFTPYNTSYYLNRQTQIMENDFGNSQCRSVDIHTHANVTAQLPCLNGINIVTLISDFNFIESSSSRSYPQLNR